MKAANRLTGGVKMDRSCLIWFAIVPLFIIAGCLAKSGSSCRSWVKDNISQEQLRNDYEECRKPTEPSYVKDGVSTEEYENDSKTCMEVEAKRAKHMEAADTLSTIGFLIPILGYPLFVPATISMVLGATTPDFQRCMKKKGYQGVGLKKGSKAGNEINACMREKGYEWN